MPKLRRPEFHLAKVLGSTYFRAACALIRLTLTRSEKKRKRGKKRAECMEIFHIFGPTVADRPDGFRGGNTRRAKLLSQRIARAMPIETVDVQRITKERRVLVEAILKKKKRKKREKRSKSEREREIFGFACAENNFHFARKRSKRKKRSKRTRKQKKGGKYGSIGISTGRLGDKAGCRQAASAKGMTNGRKHRERGE